MFKWYAEQFGWQVRTWTEEQDAVDILTGAKLKAAAAQGRHAPVWAGPWSAKVIFLGERRNENTGYGTPFNSRYTMEYGRALGPKAMQCAWTNIDCDPKWLRGKAVIACGTAATDWCYRECIAIAATVPHPSYLFRWGGQEPKRAAILKEIQNLVNKELSNGN